MRSVRPRPSVWGLIAGAALSVLLASGADAGPFPSWLSGDDGSSPSVMQLGAPSPAPRGFLDFCARRPDQCGLDGAAADASDRTAASGLRQRLYSKYYWTVAFQQTGADAFTSPPTAGGRVFDWGAIFGRSATPTEASNPRPAPPAAPGSPPPLPSNQALLTTLAGVNSRINGAIRYATDRALYGTDDYWTLPLDAGGPHAGDCKDYVLEKRRALADAGVPQADLSIAIVRTSWGETHAVLLVSTDRGELVLDSLSAWVLPWRKVHYTWIERQAPGQPLVWVKLPPRGLAS